MFTPAHRLQGRIGIKFCADRFHDLKLWSRRDGCSDGVAEFFQRNESNLLHLQFPGQTEIFQESPTHSHRFQLRTQFSAPMRSSMP